MKLRLNRHEHVVYDTNVAQHVREITGDDRYMTYWHKVHGHFVLALWVSESRGLVQELPVFFQHEGDLTTKELHDALELMTDRHWKKVVEAGKQAKLSRKRFVDEFVEEERERASKRAFLNRHIIHSRRGSPALYMMN